MSKLIENFNPDDATREQLLSILEELNEKLIPAPAPKPEPVKRGQLCLAPCQELRESMTRHLEAAEKDARWMMQEIKKFIRTCPPSESGGCPNGTDRFPAPPRREECPVVPAPQEFHNNYFLPEFVFSSE